MARTTLAAALLAFAASAAGGDWSPVSPDNGIYAAYADRSTIRREGAVATMQGMYDFQHGDFTPSGTPFFSTIVEREYECGQRKVRLMRFEDHAQHAGEGPVVSAFSDPRRWEAVVEGSLDAAYWKIACEAI